VVKQKAVIGKSLPDETNLTGIGIKQSDVTGRPRRISANSLNSTMKPAWHKAS
jgi:hypothetical protein